MQPCICPDDRARIRSIRRLIPIGLCMERLLAPYAGRSQRGPVGSKGSYRRVSKRSEDTLGAPHLLSVESGSPFFFNDSVGARTKHWKHAHKSTT